MGFFAPAFSAFSEISEGPWAAIMGLSALIVVDQKDVYLARNLGVSCQQSGGAQSLSAKRFYAEAIISALLCSADFLLGRGLPLTFCGES